MLTRGEDDEINEDFLFTLEGHTIMVKQIIQALIRRVETHFCAVLFNNIFMD